MFPFHPTARLYSVVVAYRGEFSNIEEIELDPASETAVNLLRCLLAEFGLTVRLTSRISESTESSRARLIIGDQAISFPAKHADTFQFWDLVSNGKKLTGLPFVYALWLIRPRSQMQKSIAQTPARTTRRKSCRHPGHRVRRCGRRR